MPSVVNLVAGPLLPDSLLAASEYMKAATSSLGADQTSPFPPAKPGQLPRILKALAFTRLVQGLPCYSPLNGSTKLPRLSSNVSGGGDPSKNGPQHRKYQAAKGETVQSVARHGPRMRPGRGDGVIGRSGAGDRVLGTTTVSPFLCRSPPGRYLGLHPRVRQQHPHPGNAGRYKSRLRRTA